MQFDLWGDKYRAGEQRYRDASGLGERCSHCGRPVNVEAGSIVRYVHYTTSGDITSEFDFEKVPDSQGGFPIGPECAKKLPRAFVKQYRRREDQTIEEVSE